MTIAGHMFGAAVVPLYKNGGRFKHVKKRVRVPFFRPEGLLQECNQFSQCSHM